MGVIHEHIVEGTASLGKMAFANAVISLLSLASGKATN